LTPTHTANPYPVSHRHTSTKNIGFRRFAEVCRLVDSIAVNLLKTIAIASPLSYTYTLDK